jgi:hypothetical protein
MKSRRLMLSVVLLSLSTWAFSGSDVHKSADQPVQSEAQKSFTQMKDFAGTWQGPVTVDPPQPDMNTDKPVQISLRVTSRGNALVHEMQEAGTPLDPKKYDHPVTMFYLDQNRLLLTHYCDAGNRPRMVARTSPDGKKVEFDFLDVAGGTEYGHMHHAVFTTIDADHHIEDWTYILPGNKPVHAHMDLRRTK